MSISARVLGNVEALHYCGLGSLLRFTKKGSPITRVRMKGVGTIYLRFADSDLATFKQVFVDRDYDLGATGSAAGRVLERYKAIIADGRTPVIVDAGANVGAASLWFARLFPEARILAVEPDPGNAKLLRLNVAETGNVTVVEAAIAGTAGKVSLCGNGRGWAVQTVRSDDGTLPAMTMEQIVSMVPGGELLLAKIDIEGFESDLFAGDTKWIDQAAAVIIEPHDWLFPGRRTSRSFQAAMGSRDFELFISGDNLIYVAGEVERGTEGRESK